MAYMTAMFESFQKGLRNKRRVRSARSAMTPLLVIPTVNRNFGPVTRVLV
jgi:hypothetical protein